MDTQVKSSQFANPHQEVDTLVSKIRVTAAQYKDGTDIVAVEAPGEGKTVIVEKAYVKHTFGTEAFAADASIGYSSDPDSAGLIVATTGSETAVASVTKRFPVAAVSVIANEAVVISPGASPSNGDGSLEYTIFYTVEEL